MGLALVSHWAQRSFNVTGKYSFLCSWAGPEAGLGSETLRVEGEEEEDVTRRLAVQRTGSPERQGQSGHGLSRTSPQVAIITMGLVSVCSKEPPAPWQL